MIFNLQGVIGMLATPHGGGRGEYEFTPGPTFTNVKGVLVPDAPGPAFRAVANWQPLSGQSAQRLPEGARADDWREMWVATTQPISASEAKQPGGGGGKRGHTVVIEGVTYEVMTAHDWRATAGFWRLRVQKVAR